MCLAGRILSCGISALRTDLLLRGKESRHTFEREEILVCENKSCAAGIQELATRVVAGGFFAFLESRELALSSAREETQAAREWERGREERERDAVGEGEHHAVRLGGVLKKRARVEREAGDESFR